MSKKTVLCGIDRESDLTRLLKGKRLSLLTAASGVNKQGEPTYEVLNRIGRLCCLFAPEHGLYSASQDGQFGEDDGRIHPETGAHLYGLTQKGHPRFAALLRETDVAVYDIQDVGARFYTYLSHLTCLMRACAEARVPLLVLDRPNPLGDRTEGFVLDESRFSSFIGEYAVPTRYGLTVGEYAHFVNEEKGIGCELTVLPCEGWTPDLYYDETDLLFVNPSPNIPSVDSALNYIGSCVYEATNLSEGRGTTRPFDMVGAPFVDDRRLVGDMNACHLPGVVFRRASFVPMFGKYQGELCHGTEMHITDRNSYEPIRTMLFLFRHFKTYREFTFQREGLALRVGKDILADAYEPEAVLAASERPLQEYRKIVRKYRRYSG